jgi:hypothetical protein
LPFLADIAIGAAEITMASATKVTENRIKAKRTKMGKKRKAAMRKRGTTPTAAKLFGDA